MHQSEIILDLSNGANQKGVRDYNERLILTVLQRQGPQAGSELARRTHLSAQTVSVIVRKLEADGLLLKGVPVKGKVGKPSVPMRINSKGAVSIGFKLGRRSSELFLTDLSGNVLFEKGFSYEIALPKIIFAFMRDAFEEAMRAVGPKLSRKLCGVGIAAPFEIWKWGDGDGNTSADFLSWKDISFEEEVGRFTDVPIFVVNDATSACWAEHVYGRGREFRDYSYFFVSTFIGGGIVMNNAVFEGARGNAGAFGPIRVGDADGKVRQLLDVASIHVLEKAVAKAGHDPRHLWVQPQDWSPFKAQVDEWIERASYAMAQASLTICSVIDFEAVLIDGFFPEHVRSRLTDRTRAHICELDSRGLIVPRIESGVMGGQARAIGAACAPIFSQYFLGSKTIAVD